MTSRGVLHGGVVTAIATGFAPGRILRTLFTLGPMSRADLTRATNMSRSTVGGALADLERWGLVDSTMPDEFAKAGRPSASVAVVASSVYGVVLDIAPHAIRHAVIRLDGSLSQEVSLPLVDHDPGEVVATIAAIVRNHQERTEGHCAGVGVSLPGVVSGDGAATLVLPLGWEQVPFGERLAEALGHVVPVGVEQDALLAAKSEFVWGAGAGLHRMLYLIARNHGVGGAIVGAGLLEGAHHPLQAGHIPVRTNGKPCECGNSGCLETYIDADAVRGVLSDLGLQQEPLVDAVRAIAEGPHRERFAEEVIEPLRAGLVILVNALGPDGVVLGGGLGTLAEMFFPELEGAVAGTVVARMREVPLLRGGAPDPILSGCGLAAFETLFRDPRECGVDHSDRATGARR